MDAADLAELNQGFRTQRAKNRRIAAHPYQFLLKIFQISGRKNCKETIFALENKIFRRKNRPAPAVHAAGHD